MSKLLNNRGEIKYHLGETATYIGRTTLLLLTGVGLILFWRGIWQTSEKVFSSDVSLVLGIVILVGLAIFEKKQIFKILGMSH